ncbi:MAG: hypothetical protein FJ390_05065 [Verrucomicrobia bacterium]|nr:hypothetical protein [Verrucomicrobiota bacterium]
MFVVLLSYKKPLEEIEKYLAEHRAFLDQGYATDFFLLSGPMNPRTGGVIISQLASREQLESILKQDPFSVHGLADYKIIEFQAVKYHRDLSPAYAKFLTKTNSSDLLNELANHPLADRGVLSHEFMARGCTNWKEALCYVNQIPYARNSNSNHFHLVLEEGRGTCSTKHALLVALAEEQNLPLQLMMGLMEMTAEKFPVLAPVLKKYNLAAVVETHCYLGYQGERIDITFPEKITYPSASDFLKEWNITPREIGDKKISLHQKEMKLWIAEKKISYTFEEMWRIREECIDALSAAHV